MEYLWARPIVAMMLIACSGAVYYFVVSGQAALEWKDIVNLIIGALIANLTSVVQFYFGSSQGSAQKTATIASIINADNEAKIDEANKPCP